MTEGRQQRRSARISSLDSWKLSALTRASGAPRGKRVRPPSSAGRPASGRGRKRGRKKRRLKAVVEFVVNSGNGCSDGDDGKVENNQQYDHKQPDDDEEDEEKEGLAIDPDDDLGGTDRSPGASSMPRIPDQKTSELILDILQKKDTHEIFAEPVDSEEVEGYYKIIEEPMDFGTMRLKLQEGIYTTLEQFERDVFLIFSNAMHFNSSTTLYYRQARSIQELAKKTFHRLKTDPENFVFDHLSRKLKTDKLMKVSRSGNSGSQGESRNSDVRSAAVASVKQRFSTPYNGSITADDKQGSLYTGLNSRRNRCSSSTVHVASLLSDHRRDQEDDLFDGWRSSFSEEDRCSTYKSSDVSASRSDSVFFPLHGGQMNLIYVNQGFFGYVESLAHFAADLGPIVQMVVARKIKRGKMLEASDANAMPSGNMASKFNQETGFTTRNSMFPRLRGSAPAPFAPLPWQCAVMDMSFVQARLNGMSACSNRQWQAYSKPKEPSVGMPLPCATWEQGGSRRNQPMPPTQLISDSPQPDLALQL